MDDCLLKFLGALNARVQLVVLHLLRVLVVVFGHFGVVLEFFLPPLYLFFLLLGHPFLVRHAGVGVCA